MKADSFAGKRVALFGLGGSGRATARALAEAGADLCAFDDNPASVSAASEEGIPTGDLREIDWSRVECLVLAPGVPLTHPKPHWTVDLAHAAGADIIGDVEIFGRERGAKAPSAPFVAITGTNGKSTTTALIAHCIRASGRDTQLGGNIGVPVLTLAEPAPERHYVVECSSYQIDLAPTLRPSVGILLNLTPDHLDRHGTMEHYASVKARLVAGSEAAVIGVDDTYCRTIADRLDGAGKTVVRISGQSRLDDGVGFDGARVVRSMDGFCDAVFDLSGIGSLRGRHNGQNAAAAVAALTLTGLSDAEIEAGLTSFPGLAHRMEEVGRLGPVLFVNDSKATNADAAATALAAFERIYWIAGGLPKEGGIASLEGFFPRIAKAYLIGEAAPAFSASIGERIPYEISAVLENAVASAAADAATAGAEAVVLLSPACASFDQYRNFEVRGDAFRALVRALPGIDVIGKG
ncbi:UDP-N-acetylmuramoylalanine--D-glutamate ligase [Fulvimarina manganoxydans]|uniref:UDP-N-acetylmuramoylalanine--D-glutamate ligase n=1 Tax=Fulvimarina manganoxydans TaxID=937218 RepID=A0A1W2AGD2_9HYPH|nr:UDP-N-acetylmuramoyl-L-alanine--D-glutamate ligase [Fulvimarina manganoxydans]SMC59769.1 UDP-N-acetylmuramoylalanine--D-glutamate ligase [Fulvimarina manganoxydans]